MHVLLYVSSFLESPFLFFFSLSFSVLAPTISVSFSPSLPFSLPFLDPYLFPFPSLLLPPFFPPILPLSFPSLPSPLSPLQQEGSGQCLFCGTLVCTPEEEEILTRDSKKGHKMRDKLLRQLEMKVRTPTTYVGPGGTENGYL